MERKASEDIGFVQGVGWAIRYMVDAMGEDSYGQFLFDESGIKLSEFKKHCDPSDYEYVEQVGKHKKYYK
jgi:hypothetical protein